MTTPSTLATIEQLSISNPSYIADPSDPTGEIVDDDILPPIPFDRQNRPQSSRTVRSTTSRSSVNNLDGRVTCVDYYASRYFSYKVNFHLRKKKFISSMSSIGPRFRKSSF